MSYMPRCGYFEHSNCFAKNNGTCTILTDTDFRDRSGKLRECPFYKSSAQFNEAQVRKDIRYYSETHGKKEG